LVGRCLATGMIAGGCGRGDKKCLVADSCRRPAELEGGRWRWRGPVPGELAMGSHVVRLERDPLGGDGELPDLGLVQAGSGLQHGQGASHLRLVA
jgi:hypothetical protein